MNKALVVVDVQNDFVSGSLAVPGAPQVVRGIAAHMAKVNLQNQAVIAGTPIVGHEDYRYIVATQDWHSPQGPGDHFEKWPVHCVAGTFGAELHPTLPHLFYTTFKKGMDSTTGDGYSGMQALENEYPQPLHAWLTGMKVEQIDIVGLALDHCVRATALEAVKMGFRVRVAVNLTAAVNTDKFDEVVDELGRAEVKVVGDLILAQ